MLLRIAVIMCFYASPSSRAVTAVITCFRASLSSRAVVTHRCHNVLLRISVITCGHPGRPYLPCCRRRRRRRVLSSARQAQCHDTRRPHQLCRTVMARLRHICRRSQTPGMSHTVRPSAMAFEGHADPVMQPGEPVPHVQQALPDTSDISTRYPNA